MPRVEGGCKVSKTGLVPVFRKPLGAGDKMGARGMINKEHRRSGRREQPGMVSRRASEYPWGKGCRTVVLCFRGPRITPTASHATWSFCLRCQLTCKGQSCRQGPAGGSSPPGAGSPEPPQMSEWLRKAGALHSPAVTSEQVGPVHHRPRQGLARHRAVRPPRGPVMAGVGGVGG